MDILKRVKGIGVIALHQRDIVRHRLVQNIVRAYKKHQTSRT
ncbi:MAG TPA: phosphate starvation-inducible protein PhoH, partial [Phycisphaerales bacterium]|nr:phosphate starvation-inducible protein PhoH [Phycisphaerales bacterium]